MVHDLYFKLIKCHSQSSLHKFPARWWQHPKGMQRRLMYQVMFFCYVWNSFNSKGNLGSISAALSCLVYPPRVRGRSAGSFPEQRLVIEPKGNSSLWFLSTKSSEARFWEPTEERIKFLYNTFFYDLTCLLSIIKALVILGHEDAAHQLFIVESKWKKNRYTKGTCVGYLVCIEGH